MRLHFIDTDTAVVESVRKAFRDVPEVDVKQGDLLAVAENTIVSPANSYGFMDGGIDRAYLSFFGPSIQTRVQDAISKRAEGYLPVGASSIVETGHPKIPYLVLAPTMTAPEYVTAENAYRALRAVLRVAGNHPIVGRAIYCPGLGTGVGGVEPDNAAEQMALAYSDWRTSQAQV